MRYQTRPLRVTAQGGGADRKPKKDMQSRLSQPDVRTTQTLRGVVERARIALTDRETYQTLLARADGRRPAREHRTPRPVSHARRRM